MDDDSAEVTSSGRVDRSMSVGRQPGKPGSSEKNTPTFLSEPTYELAVLLRQRWLIDWLTVCRSAAGGGVRRGGRRAATRL